MKQSRASCSWVKGMDMLIFPFLHTPISLTRQESQHKAGEGGDVIILLLTVQWGSGIQESSLMFKMFSAGS